MEKHRKQRGREMKRQRQLDRHERLKGGTMTETEPQNHGLLEPEGTIANIRKPPILQIRKLRQRKVFAAHKSRVRNLDLPASSRFERRRDRDR